MELLITIGTSVAVSISTGLFTNYFYDYLKKPILEEFASPNRHETL